MKIGKIESFHFHRRTFILLAVSFLLIGINLNAQENVRFNVRDSATQLAIEDVQVVLKGSGRGTVTDSMGNAFMENLPNGINTFIFQAHGYLPFTTELALPVAGMMTIYLLPEEQELEEIIVEGTRSNKSISNSPTRVEVLTEEIDEASTMDPSKIAHLITHSTGIQVQQTSATSNTANVRIQGLDGRYTQILKDGFPIYGGFSGSLSIMQIPPLDLRQVEYIKGSASTLYGGGAIAGLINLISKEPTKQETLLHLNASHIGAFDVNAFVSQKVGKVGFTFLGQRNTHAFFDADKDGFTDCPQLYKYNLNPKVFFYFSERSKLSVGATFTDELRQGGDVKLMNGESADSVHFYKETNDVTRTTTQVKFDHFINDQLSFTLKNSFNFFKRTLDIIPSSDVKDYRFAGNQTSSFSEAALTFRKSTHHLVVGVNLYTDDFKEDSSQSVVFRNEAFQTIGGFANYNLELGTMLSMEVGFRGDYVLNRGFYPLPRAAFLMKWTEKISTRISGGMGYRNPTIFNQEAEILAYRNVLPIDFTTVKEEKSYGGSADIGFKTRLGKHYSITLNQMLFWTHLDKPLIIRETSTNSENYHFINASGFTQSYGAETFFKFGFYDFMLFVGYTYTNASNHFDTQVTDLPLTPNHSIKGDLLYAIAGKWRVGMDYEYKSSQRLSNGNKTKEYWTFGVVIEYTWKQFTLFGNVENYTNVRQTNFENMTSLPYNTPQFTEVWAPLDGIVFNGGIKVRW
jgi:outer membrane receptor for ferrienterochelin and colicins